MEKNVKDMEYIISTANQSAQNTIDRVNKKVKALIAFNSLLYNKINAIKEVVGKLEKYLQIEIEAKNRLEVGIPRQMQDLKKVIGDKNTKN